MVDPGPARWEGPARRLGSLATYKTKRPTQVEAPKKAREILSYPRPDRSLDPETIGLWAAVHKQLYELEADDKTLGKANTAT